MSGAQTSGFPNVLFNAPAAYQAAQQYQDNQLLMQQHQQAIGAGETEMAARIAGSLLTLPDEQARAAAYPTYLAQARANNYRLPHAPETYPGEAAIRATAQMGTPSADLFKYGIDQQAKGAIAPGDGSGAVAGTGGGPVVAPATSGTVEPDALTRAQAVRDGLIKRGLDVDTATAFAANSLHESGANPNTGAGDAGASHGLFQWRDDRYNRFGSVFGKPLDNAPLDQQLDYVVHELSTTEGAARDRIAAAQGPAGKAAAVSQFYLRPKDVQPEMARRSATATQLATQWGGAGTSTAAPVVTGDSLASSGGLGGSGVVGDSPAKVLARVQAESRAGKYDGQPVVLSTGASNNPTDLASVEQQLREAQGGNAGKITVLGVGPAVEAKAPGTNAKLQALAKSYGADFVPLPADQMSPDGVHPTAQGYATLKAAIAPPQGGAGAATADGRYQIAGPPVAGPGGAAGPSVAGLKYNINSQGAPAGTILGYLPNGNAVLAGPGGVPQGVTGWNADGTPVMGGSGQPPAAPVQPQAQAVPQPPANRVMPGGADGPPVQQPPAPVATAQQPPAADTLPPLPAPIPPAPTNRNGLTAFQQQDINNRRGLRNVSADELQKRADSYVSANAAAAEKYQQDYVAYVRELRERQTTAGAAAHQTLEEQRQAVADAATAAERARVAARETKQDDLAAAKWKAEQDKTTREVDNPFGDSESGKLRYILSNPTSDPQSPSYHAAWAAYANPQTVNGVTMPGHVMTPFRPPLDADGVPVTTYDKPAMALAPGDLSKYRAITEQAGTLTAALDDFAKTARNASLAERGKTALGASTDLRSAWTNAALLAKGQGLFDLGVLSGPDMQVIRGALADPSTFIGAFASNDTIDHQVDRIKRILATRLDQARESYIPGVTKPADTKPADTPASRPPLSSFEK